MVPDIRLTEVSREDVERLAHWLDDEEIKGLWYGTDESGDPLHIGYSPRRMLNSTPDEWEQVFNDEDRKIFSIYDAKEGHIGEAQMVIESPLHEAQVFVIIGRKDLWHHHFGSAAMLHLLDLTFLTYKLHRAWVDVPDYNIHAQQMCDQLGFLLEGHLRSTHPKDGEWFDSMIMGMLETEFTRRRTRLVERIKELPS